MIAQGVFLAGLNESLKQSQHPGIGRRHVLGMPLHSDKEAGIRYFDAFDDAV